MRIDATIESGYPGISFRQLERADMNAWLLAIDARRCVATAAF